MRRPEWVGSGQATAVDPSWERVTVLPGHRGGVFGQASNQLFRWGCLVDVAAASAVDDCCLPIPAPLGNVSRDRPRTACEVPEIFTLPRTPDPLAPAYVVVGPAIGSGPRDPMFKRVSVWPRRGDGVRSRDGLVH
jgi:hypothetical protein